MTRSMTGRLNKDAMIASLTEGGTSSSGKRNSSAAELPSGPPKEGDKVQPNNTDDIMSFLKVMKEENTRQHNKTNQELGDLRKSISHTVKECVEEEMREKICQQ